MGTYENIRDLIMCELEEITRGGKMDPNMAHYIGELVDIIKDVDEIEMKEGIYEQEYAQKYPVYYDDGNSYRNGPNIMRGRGGYSGRRYGRGMMRPYTRGGMYSRDEGKMNLIEKLEHAMNEATEESDRVAIQKLIDKMEND